MPDECYLREHVSGMHGFVCLRINLHEHLHWQTNHARRWGLCLLLRGRFKMHEQLPRGLLRVSLRTWFGVREQLHGWCLRDVGE